MFEFRRGQGGDVSEWERSTAEVLLVKMRCHVFPPSSLSLSPSPAAAGFCLCDANCFCYLCQVPTLSQHILQTGPGPSAAFCVCLRVEKKLRCHLQRVHHCSSSRPWLSEWHNDTHSHTLSEVEGICGGARKQKWHMQLLKWNKIIQEVPALRRDTVLCKAFTFCKPYRDKFKTETVQTYVLLCIWFSDIF